MIDWSPHSSNFLIPTGLFSLYHDAVAMDSFNEPNQRQEERRVYQEVFNFAQGAMETYMAKQKVSKQTVSLSICMDKSSLFSYKIRLNVLIVLSPSSNLISACL